MKKSVCLFAIFSILIIKIDAQAISEKDNSLLDNFIKSKISIIKEKIVSDTLEKVFAGTFYKVDAGFRFTDDMTYCSGDIFNIKDGALFVLDSRMDSMLTLLSLVRKDFYLKSEADARFFEASLDKIYPISDMNKKYKEHLKIADKWYFIRDTFFDSKSGYVVTVDQSSKILNISKELEALKK
jgi:hypothetical protein